MALPFSVHLPSDAELTVPEIPIGFPYLKAGAHHLGSACETVNNEFMLCRQEEQDPRKCISEGKEVTACTMNFFQDVSVAAGTVSFRSHVG